MTSNKKRAPYLDKSVNRTDFTKPASKDGNMDDMQALLKQAQKKLAEKIAANDAAGAEKVREKIKLIEDTINRQK